MGQRANYIIKEGDRLTIHYHHWRANTIASDLYLGEKSFLNFVEECQRRDEILDPVWMEGCVIIDRPLRQLYFWSLEFNRDTSVIEYYLSHLSEKWPGWNVQILRNQMYDAEKILGIDYISQQENIEPQQVSKEDIIDDKVGEWVNASVVIKEADKLFVIKTGDLTVKAIVSYGEAVISLLKEKPACELLREGDEGTLECAVIDTVEKRLIINESSFGLWEQCKDVWQGYTLIMGDYGYIDTLRFAGIDTTGLERQMENVVEEFQSMTKSSGNFDPHKFAEEILKVNKDAVFNPDFFDTVRPKPIDTTGKQLTVMQWVKKCLGLK